jgi:xylulokinase
MAVGGGVRNDSWIQIKADVSGVAHRVLDVEEAAVRGAAFTAAVGSRLVPVEDLPPVREVKTVHPNPSRHDAYLSIYENMYLPLQGPLRRAAERGAEQAGASSHA